MERRDLLKGGLPLALGGTGTAAVTAAALEELPRVSRRILEAQNPRVSTHLKLLIGKYVNNHPAALDALSEIGDSTATLEARVRSYFDSNCAYCHNSTAAPEGTAFVLEFDTPLADSGLVGGATADPLGLGPPARVIAADSGARSSRVVAMGQPERKPDSSIQPAITRA